MMPPRHSREVDSRKVSAKADRQRYARRFRKLSLDYLEDRCLLSTDTWTGAGNNGLWSTASNWSTGVPISSQDVVSASTAPGTTITSSGTVSILSLTSAKPLAITGGSFATTNPSTLSNNLTLSGGTLGGTGTLTINGSNSGCE